MFQNSVITQCSIRHLYTAEGMDPAAKNACIDTAKTFERRRCNHHTLPEPLSALECIKSVVDPKDSGTNKHRYVVASQEQKLRSTMRNIAGVPLIYINRSVMIMEPMAQKTEEVRDGEERAKVRAGLKPRRGQAPDEAPLKRKRSDDDDKADSPDAAQGERAMGGNGAAQSEAAAASKKRRKGPKAPNPLSMKKAKKPTVSAEVEAQKQLVAKAKKQDPQAAEKATDAESAVPAPADGSSEVPEKKKRRRKHKSAADTAAETDGDGAAPEALAAEA